MPEPEGRGGEGVGGCGVERGVVLVSPEDLRHGVVPEYEREVLSVGDVLQLRHQDIPSRLEELLVLPVRVDVGQLGGESVVLPLPDDVVEDKPRLLVESLVSGFEAQSVVQPTLPSTGRLRQRVSSIVTL